MPVREWEEVQTVLRENLAVCQRQTCGSGVDSERAPRIARDRSLTSLGKNQKNRSGNPRGAIKNAGRCHRKSIFSQALTVAALKEAEARRRHYEL